MSIKKKLFIYLMLLFLVAMIILAYLILHQQKELIQDEMEQRGRVLASTLAQVSVEPLLVYEISTMEQNVDSIKQEKDVIYARVVSINNLILADTNRELEGEIIVGERKEDIVRQGDMLISFADIRMRDRLIGHAEVGLSLNTMKKKIGATMRMILLVFGIAFIITLFMVKLMIDHLLKPVTSLATAVRKIPEGVLELSDIKSKSLYGEVKELHDSIIWMYEELKKFRRELVERTQLATIGKMSTYIAHEIRNPLEAISGAVEVVKGDSKPEVQEDYLDIIKEEIKTLNEFLNNFMSFARPQELDSDLIRIETVIENILHLFKPMLEKSEIEIVFNGSSSLFIRGDIKRLECVFTNIILNAIEAIRESGIIEINICSRGQEVVTSIRDTGQGIKPENVRRVFNPFFTTKKTGTGIGLSIAREIIEMHNGSIEVESQKNKGTKFTIRLPGAKEDNDEENTDN